METILLIAVVVALLGLAGSTAVVGRVVLTRINERPPPVAEPVRIKWTDQDLADMSHRIDHLQEAVAEGITKVTRNENRIAKTVTSARRLVREAGLEHAGIEAEFEELQPPDGEGIEPMPAMPEQVEEGKTVRIPGGNLTIGVA